MKTIPMLSQYPLWLDRSVKAEQARMAKSLRRWRWWNWLRAQLGLPPVGLERSLKIGRETVINPDR